MINFHFADISIIVLYFSSVIILGFLSRKRQKDTTEDYILAGRRLTLPGFTATLVTTWYGGILGVGEFTFRYGIVNWITQGVFFYIFAVIFALFLAKRVQKSKILTIPDLLENSYGKPAAIVGAFFTFLMVSPAPYLLILGVLLNVIFGWNLLFCILLGTVLSCLYLLSGGFRAVIRTDMLQFVLMFSGFLVIVPAAVFKFGGLEYLKLNLPETHLTFTGELGAGYIIVWGFIALWTLVDPGFYQRCLAAKDGKTAQKGIFAAVGFWILFDFLTCTAGLYARAAIPEADPLMAYPLLAENLLPVFWKGLFFTGMLAVVMSTVDSFTFLSALTIGNDFIGRIRKSTGKDVRFYTQTGLVITAAGAVLIAWHSRSVIDIWYTIGSLGIPALLIPVVSSYSAKRVLKPRAALLSMILSAGVSAGWLIYGYLNPAGGYPSYPLNIEPLYPGLAVSIVVFLISFLRKFDYVNNRI